ncbi:MAG: hypothetical protein JW701_09525 [Kosmotogaceae bacterium]|nr:hypothetical protein [Kosmotogaceae bacterium]
MRRTRGIVDIGLIVGVLSIMVLGILSYLFPTTRIPNPGGEYEVGLQVIELNDETRFDPFSDVEMTRRLVIDIWYPADETEGKRRSPWFRNHRLFVNSLADNYDLPPVLFQFLRSVKTNSFTNAVPSESAKNLPVVILSPGTPAIVPLYFSFAEYMASRGFVVIGVEHPYAAAVVEFSDGTQFHFDRERVMDLPGVETFEEGVRLSMQLIAEDLSFVIDWLARVNQSDHELAGIFDTSRMVTFGHSGGGGAVHFASINDPRIKALVSFDPALFVMSDAEINRGIEIPSLIMETDEWKYREESGRISDMIEASPVPPFHIRIPEAKHPDFAMLDRLSPLAHYLGFTGDFMKDGGEGYLYRAIYSFIEYVFGNQSREELCSALLQREDVRVFEGLDEIIR